MMPRYMVKLADDAYVEWSTVVDAPVSHVMTRAQAVATDAEGPERVARCDVNGHSALWFGAETAAQLVAGNRAGENESELTVVQILKEYAHA